MDRALARAVPGPLGAEGQPPDDGRRDRRDRRPDDPRSATAGWPTSRRATTSASISTARSSRRCPTTSTRWGTHPSWSRLLGSPVLYPQIEERLTDLLGCEDTLVLPTITHIHMSVIPVLAGGRHDLPRPPRPQDDLRRLRRSPRGRGATVKRFRFEDPDHLEPLLRADRARPALICMDGVNSMTGNAPDLPAFAEVARELRRAAVRRRRPRLRRDRRARRRRALPVRRRAATASSATSTRATTT